MNASSIILIFLTLAVLSLLIVSVVNQQETKRRTSNQQIQALRRRIIELQEIATTIEAVLENLTIPMLVNDEIISVAETIVRVDPNNRYAAPIKDAAIADSESLSQGTRNRPLNRALASDAAIAKHQYQLKEAAAIVRKQHTIGKFGTDRLDTYIQEISWASLMIDVISMVGQGHIAIDKSNIIKATSYYNRAHQLLSSSNISDPRRDIFIKELSEMLANKRKTPSTSLMPEVHLNPQNDPHAGPK